MRRLHLLPVIQTLKKDNINTMSKRKNNNTTKTVTSSDDNGSDFLAIGDATEKDITQTVYKSGPETELSPIMLKMVLEAARHGAEMALSGENIEFLEKEIKKKERKLHNLIKEKQELQEKLNQQSTEKESLELQLIDLENKIKLTKHQLESSKKRLDSRIQELEDEKSKNDALLRDREAEIERLRKKYNNLQAQLTQRKCSENVAAKELSKLRDEQKELKSQIEILKKKK